MILRCSFIFALKRIELGLAIENAEVWIRLFVCSPRLFVGFLFLVGHSRACSSLLLLLLLAPPSSSSAASAGLHMSTHSLSTHNLLAHNLIGLATLTSTLRGRRGTYGSGLALVARLVPSGRRGRRGCCHASHATWRHQPPLCGAGVALGDIPSTLHGRCGTCGTGLALVARLVPGGRRGCHGCWRGRRGTW